MDRSLSVALPLPTALEVAAESMEDVPRLEVLGPMPSEKIYIITAFEK